VVKLACRPDVSGAERGPGAEAVPVKGRRPLLRADQISRDVCEQWAATGTGSNFDSNGSASCLIVSHVQPAIAFLK
jgi:hypothetical protein